jgi:FkbM family methyltransferase
MELKTSKKPWWLKLFPEETQLKLYLKFLKIFNYDMFIQRPFINLSFSQEGEDLILWRLLEGQNNGFYVDVGAHHPFRYSNTAKLHLVGWRGINLNPWPGSMDLFKKHRPQDINIETAIGNHSGKLIYHIFSEPAFNTFRSEKVDWVLNNNKAQVIDKLEIDVVSLKSVLDKYLPEKTSIDLLSIDVEGMDLEVLKSNDWSLYPPRFIIVESFMTRLDEQNSSEVHEFLVGKGYYIVAKAVHSFIYAKLPN